MVIVPINMLPELGFDILRLIVEQAMETGGEGVTEVKSNQQRMLSRLMQVSQVFHDICSPQLYKDCQVRDPSRFITTADSNRGLLSSIQTLRIYDSLSITDPTLIELLLSRAEWSQLGLMRYRGGKKHLAECRRDLRMKKHSQLPLHANTLRLSVKEGNWLFPNLTKVVMTGIGDSSWSRLRNDINLEMALGDNRLAFSLLSLPSVEHYCQTSTMGPLSLSGIVVKPLHPPKIVTHHYALPETQWPYPAFEPIVLGAINRFIYCGSVRFGTLEPITADIVDHQFLPLLDGVTCPLMTRGTVVREIDSISTIIGSTMVPYTEEVPIEEVSLDGTYIEVYNLARNFQDDHEQEMSSEETKTALSWPFSLDVCEALERLGDTRWGRWKGRVKIRNREDIPACPSCGFYGNRPEGVDPF